MTKFAEYSRGEPEPPAPVNDLMIRHAREADVETLAAIAAERESEPIERWRDSFRRLLLECESGRACALVAEVGTEVVAFGKAAHFTPPEGSPANTAPSGWYLSGVVVRPGWRRRGIGSRLTSARLAWIAERDAKAYYFANARNLVSVDLHRHHGFVELTRDFHHPQATFEGGVGILFVCEPGPAMTSRSTSPVLP